MDQRDASASKNPNERKVLLRANSIILTVRSFTLNYLHSDVRLYQMASWNKILRFFSENARFKNVLIKEKLDALWKVVLLIVYWLQLTNFLYSFCFNQLVCCESWFKFTWQLQAKLTAHSWCWEHFCDVETILTHPTDYSWSPPNFRQPKTSVSS